MSEFPAEEPRLTPARPTTPIPVEVPRVDSFQAALQTVGTVLRAPVDQEPPPGWVRCDGTTYNSAEHPEFVEAMGITERTFTVPAPASNVRGDTSVVYIIKLADLGDPRTLRV